MQRLLAPVVLAGMVLWGLAAAAADVEEFQLDNGLRLLVKEDHRAPVVVSQVWYKVGSSYEHVGLTGISHVLEHMMFKGTDKHPPGEFSEIIARNGGRENAFTSRDYTAYFQRLEKSRLKVSFELEADRMQGLLLPPEEFEKEVRVVMEERRLRTEDDPQSLTYERFNAVAYMVSPYRNPVIGWMHDLQNLRVEDLQSWYQRWYAPNNATVVVVGDVDPQQVYGLAKKYFAPLKPAEVGAPKPEDEPAHRGLRRVEVEAPAKVPYLLMGYKVPVIKTAERDWEPYALEVLAGILDGGDSARMSRELVRGSGIAASAGCGYGLHSRLASLFLLEATPAPERDLDALEQALREQIERLRTEPVESAELERVKAQVVADDVFERDSMFYQAMQIGTLETVGLGWEHMQQYVPRIRAVTAEQVREVAQKYLTEDRLTVARLKPQPVDNGPARSMPDASLGGARVH